MNAMNYILEVNICFTLLFMIYYIFLRNLTFFQLNRFYLLVISGLSFIIPFYNFLPTELGFNNIGIPTINLSEITLNGHSANSTIINLSQLYFIVTTTLFLIFSMRLIRFIKLIYSSEKVKYKLYTALKGKIEWPTFSFFNYIHLNPTDDNPAILEHEYQHVKHGHSLDNLYFELLKIVNWFNPLMYIAHIELKRVHEFTADQEAISKSENKAAYCRLLLSRTVPHHKNVLSSFFSKKSDLKQRIQMISKPSSLKLNVMKYLFIIPAILFISLALHGNVSSTFQNESIHVTEKDSIYDKVDIMPQFGGGMEDLILYLSQQINYPLDESGDKIEGKVYISFIVDQDGNVKNAEVLRGESEELKEEALRVVREMPKWTPGSKDGKNVSVRMSLPFVFTPGT